MKNSTLTASFPIQQQLSHEMSILIVDDDPLVLEALKHTLTPLNQKILTASNATAALSLLRQTPPVALIICDLLLPGMSGSALLQTVETLTPDTIRIALTGNSDLYLALEAINIGHVSHFIMKPWDSTILIQTVKSALDKYQLILENQRLIKTIVNQHQELEKNHQNLCYELQLGARIHEQLLLGKIPENLDTIEIAALTIPSKEIDGDFYDFYHPIDSLLDIAIGDVMGKGIPAALVGIALKIELQRFALPFAHASFCEKGQLWQEDLLSPEKIVGYTSEAISSQLMQLDYFSTLFYGRFNFNKKIFTYVDCGSPKPIHYSSSEGKCKRVSNENFPIGIVAKHSYKESEVSWEPNDLFIFYSDGVIESNSPNHECFGVDRLQNLIEANADVEANDLIEIIKQEIVNFSERPDFLDDITLIVAKLKPQHFSSQPETLKMTFHSSLTELPALRTFIDQLCQKAPKNRDVLSKNLQLAINEAFCNIVKHSYKNFQNNDIIVCGELLEDGLLIDICDFGEEFDPILVPQPNLSAINENGYGLFIMNNIADKIVYLKKRKKEGMNRLRIFKKYSDDEA